MDFYMEKRGQHWHENRQQPLKHIRRRVAKAKKNDTLEIFRAANNFKTIMDIMFGNKCRKKPKKKIFAAKWPTELNEPNTRGRRPSQPMNWLRKMEKSERSNSTSDSIKRHSCLLWPEPWWKRKLQAICFLRFYFENIYLRSVCACASPSISIFPYFIPLFFLASFTCIGPAPKAGWCFILFCERNDSRLNVFFCANCEPFFAIVSGNEKRVVRYIQRLSQIGSQTKVVWVHSRLCIFLTSGRSFSFFAASVRLSSFGNRRRHRKRVLFLAHRHRERKKTDGRFTNDSRPSSYTCEWCRGRSIGIRIGFSFVRLHSVLLSWPAACVIT